MYICIYIRIYVYICMYVYMYMCICVYIYCEWLTEVAQSKTNNLESLQWVPRLAAICFVPPAESVKSETLEKVDKSSWPQL